MRRLLTIIAILFVNIIAMAQAPSKMSYQAVIRSNNTLVVSTQIGMRMSIIKDSATGIVVYQETYNPQPTTNANGLVSVEIGGGNPSFGLFENIDWSAATYFVKIETDVTGGTNYTNVGVNQLLRKGDDTPKKKNVGRLISLYFKAAFIINAVVFGIAGLLNANR